MKKRYIYLSSVAAMCYLFGFSGCKSPSHSVESQIRPRTVNSYNKLKTEQKKIDWEHVKKRITERYKQKKGKVDEEFSSLLSWIIIETKDAVEKGKKLKKKDILRQFKLKRSTDKEFQELLDWTIQEIEKQIRNGKPIIIDKKKKKKISPLKLNINIE